jgi:cytochrome c oxidase subunit 1
VGGFLFGISALIWLWNMIVSARKGEVAGPDPWGASTLEWAIPSPPPHYNFGRLPVVRTREPLWHEDEKREVEAATMAEPETEPIMPGNSHWPIVVALGTAGTWALIMTGVWWVPLLGVAFTGFGVFMWAFEDPFAHVGSAHD